ncbi:undecaprenyl-diphosphate phosphatase [Thermococcus sp. 21S7]|uniref:undecaprenyl-diphosphate phosphatase n=1 Tax=Thermococcus sp. 21S7 TaxID=1638221 RepID=UPI001438F48B|nr:undecaprenyl-diphosphate phosphatase [Thermococcus sp. 21S7]NJE60793.1 undecaprenyl-diphosphate phosphatase [Thermococcus sp. 21S7]
MVNIGEYVTPLVSGIVVALSSWLSISPEGYFVSNLLRGIDQAYVDYLVPAYLGVTFAVLFYFKEEIALGSQNVLRKSFDPDTRYLLYAAIFTVLLGYPILVEVRDVIGPRTSDMVNAAIGALIILLGLLAGTKSGAPFKGVESRIREEKGEATLLDAMLSGLSQGIALLGGISRSGLVLLGLLCTGINVRRALEMSFIVAPVYFVMKLAFLGGWEPALPVSLLFTAFLAAFVVSIVTMKSLVKLSESVSRRGFLVAFGSIAVAVYLLGVIL